MSDMLNLDPGPYWDESHPKVAAALAAGKWWPKPGYQYAEGRKVANKVKATLPRYDDLQKRLRRKIKQVGFLTTLYGHKQVIGEDKQYIGLNALIQGGAAGIFKEGLLRVEEAVRPLDAHPVLLVHDEIGLECPIEHAEECLMLTKREMEAAYPLDPALKVSGTIAWGSYAEAK